MKVAILGGGLSGLTLGYLFSQKSVDFEILEKENECGGLMRSLQKQDFTFDYGGSHIIFSKNEEVLRFILDFLGNNKVRNTRKTKILYKGRYVKYPFENGLADLPVEENFECLYSFVQNLIRKEKEEIEKPNNLKQWFRYTFGEGIAEKYLIPFNEKIWKYPLEDIDLEWVERIPNPPVEDIMKSAIGIETEGYTHQINFYYPEEGGIQSLTRSLETMIKDRINLSFEVKTIKKDKDKWIISNGKEERKYTKIISTIPIQNLIKSLDHPKKIEKAVNSLRYNSLVTVMIGLNIPKINELSWLYIPDKTVLAHRISFPSNYSPKVAPTGKSSVLAEITCNVGSGIWNMKDESLVDRVIEDLHNLKIINRKDVVFAETKRMEYAYVINDLAYDQNRKIVKDYVNGLGIDLLGRFAEFKYLNMDACVENAIQYSKNTQ
jgi:protoporphyrinogen oxidase